MSTTNLPDQGNRHFTSPPQPRPPRTEPSYPPEPPPEPAPSVSRNGVVHPPTPFALIAQRAERQPPKVVLTADEAAERMRSLKERQTEDPVLKLQIVELQAKLADQRIRIDDLTATMEAAFKRIDGLVDLCKAQQQEMRDMRKILIGHDQTFSVIKDRLSPPPVAALPPKKIAAKKKPKP